MESQTLINFIWELLILPVREGSLKFHFAEKMANRAYV